MDSRHPYHIVGNSKRDLVAMSLRMDGQDVVVVVVVRGRELEPEKQRGFSLGVGVD